jgi:hypothetical protein
MKQLFIIIFLACSMAATAQTPAAPAPAAKPDTSVAPAPTVVVSKDPRMELLAGKKIAIAKEGLGKEGIIVDRFGRVNMPGYRLQVLNTTDRTLAYQTKGTLYQKFPGHAVYVIAQAPFFKVRFGNFTSKEEADRYKKMMSPMFPAGVYLVAETIEAKINKNQPKPKEKSDDK